MPQVVSELSALTAASVTVPPAKWGKVVKPQTESKDWQGEAWSMLGIVGELSFALLWKTGLMSRVRLVASDVDPDTGKPTGTTENQAARELVKRIAGGPHGQSQMIARLAPLMMIPGEAWLAIIYPDSEEQWHILSSAELKAKGDTVELHLEDDTRYVMDPAVDTLARIWRKDPEKSWLPWSQVKAALPPLREIVRMSQNIEGAGKSRQAGNGILVVPTEMSMPAKPAPTGAIDSDAPGLPAPAVPPVRFVGAGELQQQLQDVMSTAISDPSSAEALVPIVLTAPGDHIDKIRHITFDSEVSEKAQEAREKALRRLATTLDIPAEVLLGLADLNHWSLYGIEEEAVRWHTKPEMEAICSALTNQLLRPILGEAAADVIIWYDASDIEAEPDQVDKVRNAYIDGVVSAEAYLRELGMSVEADGYDLTTKDGWAKWATDQVRRDATLFPTLAPILRAFASGLGLPEISAPAAPPEQPAIEPPANNQIPDTADQAGVTASAFTTDAAQTIRLCVNEALKLAGKRRRTRADHARLTGVLARDTHLHNHLGPVASTEVARLIDGWDEILDPESVASSGLSIDQLRTVVASVSRDALTTGTRPILGPDQ